ncbi:RES family NAD+ phosphorylase [Massilia sp. PAMC28688]|uniref:RES family NAD+ phosphorylase n=1 Tax=Massilia sp. PAMC28688 TaxID=2861283 RepID=UPI001C62D422|nr:RES family NAD+ phosphorylase [Massilia sp. PAMC28688]
MRFWRIAQRKYALDRACLGTSMYGGRWNPIGMPALYCGSTIAISSLEKFVHIASGALPPQVLVAIDVPDDCALFEPDISALPMGWDAMPTSTSAQAFGGQWLSGLTHVGMRVPSAIVNEETNIVLNPQHPEFARVSLTEIRPFTFDPRMYKTP